MWRTPGIARLGIPGLRDARRPARREPDGGARRPRSRWRWRAARPGTRRSRSASARRSATEVRAKGASVLLAPTINLLRHPRWGRAQETYGEDTLHVGRMGVGIHPRRAAPRAREREALRGEQHRGHAARGRRAGRRAHAARGVPAALPHGGGAGPRRLGDGRVQQGERPLLRRELPPAARHPEGRVGLPGLRRVRLVRRHAQHGACRPSPASTSRCRCRCTTASRSSRAVEDGGAVPTWADRRRRAPHPAREALLPARQRPAGPGSDPRREPGAPRPGARGGARGHRAAAQRRAVPCRSIARASRRSRWSASLADIANLGDQGSSVVAPSFAITPLDGIRALAGAIDVTYVPGPPLSAEDQDAVATADAAVVIAGLTRRGRGRGRRRHRRRPPQRSTSPPSRRS